LLDGLIRYYVEQQVLKSARSRIPPMGDASQSSKDQKTAIAPMLSARNGLRAIEFYKAAFGAGELFRLDDERGAVVARLSVGDAEFSLADESP